MRNMFSATVTVLECRHILVARKFFFSLSGFVYMYDEYLVLNASFSCLNMVTGNTLIGVDIGKGNSTQLATAIIRKVWFKMEDVASVEL